MFIIKKKFLTAPIQQETGLQHASHPQVLPPAFCFLCGELRQKAGVITLPVSLTMLRLIKALCSSDKSSVIITFTAKRCSASLTERAVVTCNHQQSYQLSMRPFVDNNASLCSIYTSEPHFIEREAGSWQH